MKNAIIICIVTVFFFSCTKKYITYTTINNTSVYSDSTRFVVDSFFPSSIQFNENKIISAPNLIGTNSIYLNFSDSVIGRSVSIITYINPNASINLSYTNNVVVSLVSGNFITPTPGTNVIRFTFLGVQNGINLVSASMTLEP